MRTPTLLLREGSKAGGEPVGRFVFRDVAQLVARTAGGREVAGSSPVTPTNVIIREPIRALFVYH